MKILKKAFEKQSGDFSFEATEISGGYAVSVTAHPADSSADAGEILLLPEQPAFDSYVAIHNHSEYWCRPFFGKTLSELPDRIQALLLRKGEIYRYILPLCDDVWKTVIRGTAEGMTFRMYTQCIGVSVCEKQWAWIEAEGKDPLELVSRCAGIASLILPTHPKLRRDRLYPPVLNQIGWCSWDSMQIRVCEAGLMEKAKEVSDKNIPVGFAIIDDMWANVPNLRTVTPTATFSEMVGIMHQSKLYDFEGDPQRFPNGMKKAITALKQAGIPHVGIWFPTTGYWAGMEEGSPAEKLLRDDLITACDRRLPNPRRAKFYFDKLCGLAKSWGADFLKIDNQGCHKYYRDIFPIGESAKEMQAGIEAAVAKHFDGQLINCMGMPSECMFHRRDSAVSRCSDDFIPESKAWFTKNILQCSYNGILQGQFYVNDWDMWWTDDGQAKKNSLCRAISGGPIYVSDKIGRTNPAVLRPLTLSDGSILRCADSATPTADCLTEDPTNSGKPFKIRNRIGNAGVLAVFNLDAGEQTVSGSITAEDVKMETEETVLLYDYFAGKATLLHRGDSFPVSLQNADDYRLYWLLPYNGTPALLGRTDLFMGCGAAEALGENEYTVRETGQLAVYAKENVILSVDGERIEAVSSENGLSVFSCPSRLRQRVRIELQ